MGEANVLSITWRLEAKQLPPEMVQTMEARAAGLQSHCLRRRPGTVWTAYNCACDLKHESPVPSPRA